MSFRPAVLLTVILLLGGYDVGAVVGVVPTCRELFNEVQDPKRPLFSVEPLVPIDFPPRADPIPEPLPQMATCGLSLIINGTLYVPSHDGSGMRSTDGNLLPGRYRVQAGAEHLDISLDLVDSVTPALAAVVIPEENLLPLSLDCGSFRVDTRRDQSTIQEWSSVYPGLRKLHMVHARKTATHFSVRCKLSRRLMVLTNFGSHPYHRNLYENLRQEAHCINLRGYPKQELRIPDENALSVIRRADVYHLHWPEHFLGDDLIGTRVWIDALKRANVTIVLTMHNLIPHRHRSPKYEALYQMWISECDVMHHHSHYSIDRTLARFKVPARTRHVVLPHAHWYGITYKQFSHLRLRREVEKTHSIPGLGHVIVLGVFGSPRPGKRVQAFLDAFAETTRTDLRLVLVRQPGLDDRGKSGVVWLPEGRKTDREYAMHMRSVDIVVFPRDPNTLELTSGVLADAVAVGTPGLVSDWPYVMEVLGPAGIRMGYSKWDMACTLQALTHQQISDARAYMHEIRAQHSPQKVAKELAQVLQQAVATNDHRKQ